MNGKQIICILLFLFFFLLFWETTARDYESDFRPSKGLTQLSDLLIELFKELGRQLANLGTLFATLWNWIEHNLLVYFKKYVTSFKDIIYSIGLNCTAPFYFGSGYLETLKKNADYYAAKYNDKLQSSGIYGILILAGTVLIPILILYIVYLILRKSYPNAKYVLYMNMIITYMIINSNKRRATMNDYSNAAKQIETMEEKIAILENNGIKVRFEDDFSEEDTKEKTNKSKRTTKRGTTKIVFKNTNTQ